MPSVSSDLGTCDTSLSTCTTNLAVAQACGNGVIDAGEGCNQSNLNGQTCVTQGFLGGTLKCGSGCAFDTSGCSNTRFVDNGDGTVSDLTTGLVWEQKSADGSVHDAGNSYSWSISVPNPNGTAFTDFLYGLNGGTSPDGIATSGCFTGHCDWRLPTIEELSGIIDLSAAGCGSGSPCIDPIFGPTEPAAPSAYWSLTTFSGGLTYGVWVVSFGDGAVGGTRKDAPFVYYARAVRGGL